MKGYAYRVGGEVRLPPDPSQADVDAAIEMMTPDELRVVMRRLSRQIRWSMWALRHPRLASFVEGVAAAAAMMAR